MKALILAGGRGKRLRPITDKIPKPLILINNTPLIERSIKYLKKFGINDIIICSGYKSKQIENFLKKKRNFNCKIEFSIEKTPLGTAGAIKKATEKISEESFVVIYGDVITNINLRKILNFGHTFGHGFEGAKNFSKKINHGEAVILGMMVACELSNKKK